MIAALHVVTVTLVAAVALALLTVRRDDELGHFFVRIIVYYLFLSALVALLK